MSLMCQDFIVLIHFVRVKMLLDLEKELEVMTATVNQVFTKVNLNIFNGMCKIRTKF